MTPLQFRSTTSADESAIARFLQEAFDMNAAHPMLERRHMRWKYWEERDDWPGSRSYILANGEEILAHAAVIPGTCTWGQHRIRLLQVIDWAAKSGSVGTGMALMKRLGSLADGIVAVDGSEITLELLPVVGFKEHGTVVTSYVRPIRPLVRLTAASNLSWRLAPQVLRSVFWTMGAPLSSDKLWQSRRIRCDAIADASIPWPTSNSRIAVFERTAALISYMLRCPAACMELYAVEKEGRVRGYFLLAFVLAQARLIDCWVESDELSEWRAAVCLAVRQAKCANSIAEVVSFCSDPRLSDALLRSGFHARTARPLLLRAATGTRVPDVTIRFLMFENDAAYLHNGSNNFWA
jgi:hypothetical protein